MVEGKAHSSAHLACSITTCYDLFISPRLDYLPEHKLNYDGDEKKELPRTPHRSLPRASCGFLVTLLFFRHKTLRHPPRLCISVWCVDADFESSKKENMQKKFACRLSKFKKAEGRRTAEQTSHEARSAHLVEHDSKASWSSNLITFISLY